MRRMHFHGDRGLGFCFYEIKHCYVAKAGLKFAVILLLLLPILWNYRCVSPCLLHGECVLKFSLLLFLFVSVAMKGIDRQRERDEDLRKKTVQDEVMVPQHCSPLAG